MIDNIQDKIEKYQRKIFFIFIEENKYKISLNILFKIKKNLNINKKDIAIIIWKSIYLPHHQAIFVYDPIPTKVLLLGEIVERDE